MVTSIAGNQVHEHGSVLAPNDAQIVISAGGWTFTFVPAVRASTGFTSSDEDRYEATIEMSGTPTINDEAITDTATAAGFIKTTIYSVNRAVGNSLRLLTYTVVNSSAL